MTNAVQASWSAAHYLALLGHHLTISLLSQESLSRQGPSPAAVLSLPTGVLEQLRSMVDDSEDAAPGLQPV